MTPEAARHVAKADRNKAMLTQYSTWQVEHPDWFVTFAFYAALHYVRALARENGYIITEHKDLRQDKCSAIFWPLFEPISNTYSAMKRFSETGRYDAEKSLRERNVNSVLTALASVETYVRGKLPA